MLSLSMIVRDEARRLEGCLASVRGFVEEIVVVDTGSTDDTVAVARRCGATVVQIDWPGDFAPARNQALEKVTGDWVLVLDADERLREEAREPLRRLMAQPEILLIQLLRVEQGARQSPYSNVSRLFRRHPAIHWRGAYHAQVDDSVSELLTRELGWTVSQCSVPALVHDGYSPERLAEGDKSRRLREAMEGELRESPEDPYTCAKLGALLVSEGDPIRGLTLLERGLARCASDATATRYELLVHLAMAVDEGDPARAEALYRQALALPQDPRLRLTAQLNLAALLLGRGDLEEAARLCRDVTETAPEVALGWYNLGLIERRRGRIGEAIQAYRHAIGLTPDHAETHQNLAVALLLGGDIEGSRQGFRRAISLLRRQGDPITAEALRRKAGALVKLEEP